MDWIVEEFHPTLRSSIVLFEGEHIMTVYKNRYRVESARYPGWDYSTPGWYFVTTVTHWRRPVFGRVIQGRMHLSECGKIAEHCLLDIPNHYPTVTIDRHVVMPDHVHVIFGINGVCGDERGAGKRRSVTSCPSHTCAPVSLSEVVRAFKSFSARKINVLRKCPGCALWQTRFWDIIIEDVHTLEIFRRYIQNNPAQYPNRR